MRASMMNMSLTVAVFLVGAGCSGDVLGPPMTEGRTSEESIASSIPTCTLTPGVKETDALFRRGRGVGNDVSELAVAGSGDALIAAARVASGGLREPPPPLDFDWSGTDTDNTPGKRVRCDLDMILR